MPTVYRIIALGLTSLIIGIGTNQFIHQGIRWPILFLALPRLEKPVDLIRVSVEDALDLSLKNEAFFIDIRPQIEFEIDRIPGALSMPFNQYFGQKKIPALADNNKIIIVYGFEPQNKEVDLFAEQLVKLGFDQTRVLQGGFAAWIENKYPLEKEGSL